MASYTRFGIEWAYNEFRVGRLENGECKDFWTAPYAVKDLFDLNRAMYDASQQIDLRSGGTIAIAYEDDLHTHEFLEVPAMGKKDLQKFVERRVTQDKSFDGAAAHCFHNAKRNNKVDGILLHMMPKSIVDALIRICEEYYLHPRRLVPLTEILSEHVRKLGAEADDILLVVAIFNRRVQMLVANGRGDILFVRELAYAWRHDKTDRLVVEVKPHDWLHPSANWTSTGKSLAHGQASFFLSARTR